MKRLHEERSRTVREWQSRSSIDAALEPGLYRKGRTARGCPRRCEHCRVKKTRPTPQLLRVELDYQEWLRSL